MVRNASHAWLKSILPTAWDKPFGAACDGKPANASGGES